MPYRFRRRRTRFARLAFRKRPFRRRRWKKKHKTYYDRKNNTYNASVGKRGKKSTLRSRVRRLESTTKKHYDYVSPRLTGELISWNGTDLNAPTNESFSSILAIQGRTSDGSIPPLSGSARATDDNTREGDNVFCTKVRLRGMISGMRPNPDISGAIEEWHAASGSGTGIIGSCLQMQQSLSAACSTRIHMVILKDKRPSTINPTSGESEPNPLPTNPNNPLESLFQRYQLTTDNTLGTLGLDSALRSYTSNRFSIVHHEVIQTSLTHPRKWFDVNLKVNKVLRYELPPPGGGPVSGTDPLNVNYLVYFAAVPSELRVLADPAYQLDGVPLLLQPKVSMLSSRTYFRET